MNPYRAPRTITRACIGATMVLVAVTVLSGPVGAQSSGDTGDPFVDELAACPPGHTLLVTVVSDETDPARLDVMADAVHRLANLPDRPIEVLVAVAAPDFTPVAPREAATPASADRLAGYVRLGGESDGGTLSVAGLGDAATELAGRADELEGGGAGGTCSVLLVASRGEVDPDDREEFCATSGASSQLAAAPVTVWIASESVDDDETELLTTLALGCDPSPATRTGRYVAADSVGELAAETARLLGAFSGSASAGAELPVCPAEECAEGRYELVLDPVLGRFAVTVTLPSDTARLVVSSPQGVAIALEDRVGGPIEAGSFTIQTTWITPEVVRLDAVVSPADEDWAGAWGLVVVEPDADPDESSTAGLVVSAAPGVTPRLLGSTRLIAGQAVTLALELVDDADRLVSRAAVTDAVTVLGVVRNPDGEALVEAEFEPDDEGRWRGQFELDAEVDPDAGPYSLDVVLRADSAMVDLPVVVATQAVTVLPATAWPTVETTSLSMSGTAGETAQGSVTVVGGTDADACVWLAGTTGLGDAAARLGNDARSAASCVVVPAGQALAIPLAIELDGFEAGQYEGTVVLVVGVAGDDASAAVDLPVVIQAAVQIDTASRALIAATMTLVALILPLLALWVFDWVRATFRPGRNAVATDMWISVWVDGSMYRLDADGAPLLFGNDSFVAAELPRGRRFEWRDLEFGVRNARSPLSPPVGTVSSPEGPTVASGGAIVDEASVVGRVPLNLADAWIFVLQPESTRDAAVDPKAPDFCAAYGRLILIRSSLDSRPIDLSALPRMAQRVARTVRSVREVDTGTAQEMLDFVEANATAPRDLPRRWQATTDGDEASTLPAQPLTSGDRYDFSDLEELLDPEDDEPDDAVPDSDRAEDGADDAGSREEGSDPSDDGYGLGIVFEPELNPAAFLIDPDSLHDPVDSSLVEPASAPEEAEATGPEAPDIRMGWARRAKPNWPVPGRRKDP